MISLSFELQEGFCKARTHTTKIAFKPMDSKAEPSSVIQNEISWLQKALPAERLLLSWAP